MNRFDWRSILAAVIAAALAVLGGRQFPPPAPPTPQPPTVPTPPTPPTPTVPPPAANPLDALGRLVMSGGYCSATPVTPPSKDGKQTLLSAAHCVKSIGEKCQFITRAGRQITVSVIAINRDADASLLTTETLADPLPYLPVADQTPAVNSAVFHAGFGIDKPGNVERGRILQRDTGAGQVMFELSVSPGDSGGGVCVDEGGKVVSPVCCTTNLAAVGQVFGARPEVVQEMLRRPVFFVDVPPMEMPKRMPVKLDH